MIRIALAAFAVLMFSAQTNRSAYAYCFEPIPPVSPAIYGRPKLPFCLKNYAFTREHSCRQVEIDVYKFEVEAYVEKFKDYAFDIQSYVSAAADYAVCEIDTVVAPVK